MSKQIADYRTKPDIRQMMDSLNSHPLAGEQVYMAMYILGQRNREPVTPEAIHEWLGWGNHPDGLELEFVREMLEKGLKQGYLTSVADIPGETSEMYLFSPPPSGCYRFLLAEHKYLGSCDDTGVFFVADIEKTDTVILGDDPKRWNYFVCPLVYVETKKFTVEKTGSRYKAVVVDENEEVMWQDREKRIPKMEVVSNIETIPPEQTEGYKQWTEEGWGHEYTYVPMSKVLNTTIEASRYRFARASWIELRSLDDFMYMADNYLDWGCDGTDFDLRWRGEDGEDSMPMWGGDIRYFVI